MRTATIELCKEAMQFSAGHFTIFSATERERLHGHNYAVSCSLTGWVGENGMVADYNRYRDILVRQCEALNEIFLLPGESPHLRIELGEGRVEAQFAGERIPFLAADVRVLPVRNISLEEMSAYLLEQLTADATALEQDRIFAATLSVSSAPGQWVKSTWRAPWAPTEAS